MSREQDGPVRVPDAVDYDSPWKKALEVYFREFINFFFPDMAADVDWSREWEGLEESTNPFASVVMAHLKAVETAGDNDKRYYWKLYLIKRLYKLGYAKEDVTRLFEFIDWVMVLPKDLEQGLWQEIQKMEEGKKMEYISSVERIGMEKGMEKGVLKLLARQIARRSLDQ